MGIQKMKLRYVLILILILISKNSLSSNLLLEIQQMSKEEYLNTIPKSFNHLIIQNGGRLPASPGTNMVSALREGDMMIITFEMEYDSIAMALKSKSNMSNKEISDYIKSDYLKNKMFGKNGSEKQFMINHSCTDPIKLAALKKGITTKYRYLLNTGEHLGVFKISINSCI